MKPARFAYHAPASVDEAITLLARLPALGCAQVGTKGEAGEAKEAASLQFTAST